MTSNANMSHFVDELRKRRAYAPGGLLVEFVGEHPAHVVGLDDV